MPALRFATVSSGLVERPRQPRLDPLPGPGALPAVQARARPPAAVRLERTVRGGHVPAVRVVRVHRQRPAVAVLATALGRLPAEPAIPAPSRSAARGLVGPVGHP